MKNKVVVFGEIMLRLSTPDYFRFSQVNRYNASFGGGEANVAVSLANYGMPVDFVSRMPDNDIAHACIMDLKRYGVGVDKIITGGNRMGIYFLETGAVSRGSKVIYDRAHSAISEIKPGMIDWDKTLHGADWFHWTGITPAISQGAADVCLEAIKTANKKEITVSCDLNYRKNLWKYGKSAREVMPEMVAGTDVILGNEEDAAMALGIKPEGIDVTKAHIEATAYESVSRKIMKEYPRCKMVITTLRGSVNANHNTWAGVLWDGKNLYTSQQYQITHIVDRVGGGDSFMGGLIYGLMTYTSDTQKALEFAAAASCLKHTVHGDYNQVTVQEVEKLMMGDQSGRVAR